MKITRRGSSGYYTKVYLAAKPPLKEATHLHVILFPPHFLGALGIEMKSYIRLGS